MSTPRDLFVVAMDVEHTRPVEQGDLSLALAGAEVIDLIDAHTVTLDGDLIVPGDWSEPADRLLAEAASSITRQAPYESVEEWLWRRGRGLYSAYLADLDAEGPGTRQRRRWLPSRTGQTVPVDSPARRSSADRWASQEPVLTALATVVGISDKAAEDFPSVTDEAVLTVLAAVDDAVTELVAVRQRRAIEEAAFDNIWRGP
ncbi:GPP34 family phosphoprotein [Streptomyces sp. R41]|uniref:GPP34 family phosphoprotein n=1 Tax=Streptomyces sp. R41 TaxID=3238632 RepID=A0AB39R6C5_9ACTN